MTTPSAHAKPAARRHDGPSDAFDVLDACHREMLDKVDQLERLVERLASQGIDATARSDAAVVAHFFATTARRHHEDEERHIFPALARSGDQAVIDAVLRLQQDHGWLEEDWMELSPHVQAVASGYNGYDIDVLREGSAIFAALTRDHVALEETVIYPNARRVIASNERQEMGREMAARRRTDRGNGHAR
ncbi:MAG TPA: hemerythrin domain-containing protein [Albitalea sp.]|nr:hemerythrin domain-containing protein [Albitalea sp.]